MRSHPRSGARIRELEFPGVRRGAFEAKTTSDDHADRPADLVSGARRRCDNALFEPINERCNAKLIWRCGPWRRIDGVEFPTLEWVDWFSNRRPPDPTGDIPPAEFEARYWLEQTANGTA
jgi:hypothetical protein